MNEFLNSLKADLLDRRVLPLVGVAAAALVAALAYAALAGGGSKPAPSAEAPPAPSVVHAGVSVTPAQPNAVAAVAETTDGSNVQRQGSARNPFTPLAVPGAKAATVTVTASVAKATASGGSSEGSSSQGASSSKEGSSSGPGSSAPSSTPAPKSKGKAKPKTVYEVDVAIGPIPPGSTLPSAELKELPPLRKPTPLPSAQNRLLEFVGVTAASKGNSATFAVLGEVILRGAGKCLPSVAQCELLELAEGASEQLEYIEASGAVSALELHVSKIVRKAASAATFARLMHAQRLAGSARAYGPALALAGLRFGRENAVIVYTAQRPAGRH